MGKIYVEAMKPSAEASRRLDRATPTPSRAPEARDERATVEAPQERRPAPLLQSESAPPSAAARAPAVRKSALVRELETQPPEKWLEKIAELRREGRATDAEELLAEFRKRFPEHAVPESLRR